MAENIVYDIVGLKTNNIKADPEDVYKNGYGVCAGYSRLFKHIGIYIGLNVLCVQGFAKILGYQVDDDISEINHEWNIIKLDHIYYQIDCTWGAGSLDGDTFTKELCEFHFCPDPDKFFHDHFPEDPKWQLISPSLSADEFKKRTRFQSYFHSLFTDVDIKYDIIKVKNKTKIRLYKKIDKVKFSISFYEAKNVEKETYDAKYLKKEKKDYVDLIFIFKHKGKYLTNIWANDGSSDSYNLIAQYTFESENEWGDKIFDFNMDDYDIMEKLNLESMSHKDIEFKAKNREKFSFKFKPNSNFSLYIISLTFDDEKEEQENVIKYYWNDLNLDIDVIFNKKGKYSLYLNFKDLFLNEDHSFFYYPIVAIDEKEKKVFSVDELMINEPFEASLKKIKLKYLSHKKQNIVAKRIEKFEIECEDESIYVNSYIHPENSKVLTLNTKINNKFIFYFGFNEKKKFVIEFKFISDYGSINNLVYSVDYNQEIDIPLTEPKIYNDSIVLIDPIFPCLKIGKEASLKFKSEVTEEIRITNYNSQCYKKNKNGIFEVKIIPKTEKIMVIVNKEDGGEISMLLEVTK